MARSFSESSNVNVTEQTKSQQVSDKHLETSSTKLKSFVVGMEGKRVLIAEYDPNVFIDALEKYFTVVYLEGLGIRVPGKLLIEPGSRFGGFLNYWAALHLRMNEVIREAEASGVKLEGKTVNIGEAIPFLEKVIAKEPESTPEAVASFLDNVDAVLNDPQRIAERVNIVGQRVSIATDYIAKALPQKLNSIMYELLLESNEAIFREIQTRMGLKSVSPTKKDIDKILHNESSRMKKRLGVRGRGGSESIYNFSKLGEYYEEYYALMKAACDLAKSKGFGKFKAEQKRDVLKRLCSELSDDLIDRLLSSERYESSASYLAIELAARRCGLPANRSDYPDTYLLQILSKQKKK